VNFKEATTTFVSCPAKIFSFCELSSVRFQVIEAQSFSDEELQESEAIQFSFDTFTNNTMMELMDRAPPLVEIPTNVVLEQMGLTSEYFLYIGS